MKQSFECFVDPQYRHIFRQILGLMSFGLQECGYRIVAYRPVILRFLMQQFSHQYLVQLLRVPSIEDLSLKKEEQHHLITDVSRYLKREAH